MYTARLFEEDTAIYRLIIYFYLYIYILPLSFLANEDLLHYTRQRFYLPDKLISTVSLSAVKTVAR